MTVPAVEDTNWLEPAELYLARGNGVEIDRPIYQGDVFTDVPLPELPTEIPLGELIELPVRPRLVMIVPHPCRCYHGDRLRDRLTVAPVEIAASYHEFRPDSSGWTDRFGLPELLDHSDKGGHVANFGQLVSLPTTWLNLNSRIACLSHKGLGLLAKRVLGFQLRCPVDLASAMTYTAGEWTEALLMQAWVRKHLTLAGYSKWLKTPLVINGVNGGQPIAPRDLRESGLDVLLTEITGVAFTEPDSAGDH
jgi:hypothetical protein